MKNVALRWGNFELIDTCLLINNFLPFIFLVKSGVLNSYRQQSGSVKSSKIIEAGECIATSESSTQSLRIRGQLYYTESQNFVVPPQPNRKKTCLEYNFTSHCLLYVNRFQRKCTSWHPILRTSTMSHQNQVRRYLSRSGRALPDLKLASRPESSASNCIDCMIHV